jgi:CheY-like chemotaxis protein
VTSGEEAIAAVRAYEPNVLLADLGMPGLDGFALIRCIRTLGGPSAHVPAAAFSAFTAADYRQQAQQAGFEGYLEKPVAPQALTAEVARLAALFEKRGSIAGDASLSGLA